jgi:N utilization substance protein A
MNARLAARLTGWKVDINSETQYAEAEAEIAYGGGEEGEDYSGRCSAVLSTGKRCPNASLPGSRYCGIPAHRALAEKDGEASTAPAAAPAPAGADAAAGPEGGEPAEA